MHRASVVHLSAPFALCDLMPQIWQRDVGTEPRDQILPALVAVDAHKFIGVIQLLRNSRVKPKLKRKWHPTVFLQGQ